MCTRNALRKSAFKAARGSAHKESVKRYLAECPKHDAELSDKVIKGQCVTKGFICFPLIERGKLRHIKSVHFKERVVQKSLNQNILIDCMMRSNIYDNGASQSGKGGAFFHSELTKHLIRHYKIYGSEGYTLVFDFHDFFGSADHKVLKANVRHSLDDERVIRLTNEQFIESYRRYNIRHQRMPEDEAGVGVGLGSEINQTLMVTLPNRIDHLIKEVYRIKEYDRFMDDGICIHISKEYLEEVLEGIKKCAAELGITLNEKKTYIVKLSHGFTICKVKYNYGPNGAIIRRPAHKKIVSERRKLKRQAQMLDEGLITYTDIYTSYQSWRGGFFVNTKKRKVSHNKVFHNTSLKAHRSVRQMDKLFDELFIKPFIEGGSNYGPEENEFRGRDQELPAVFSCYGLPMPEAL